MSEENTTNNEKSNTDLESGNSPSDTSKFANTGETIHVKDSYRPSDFPKFEDVAKKIAEIKEIAKNSSDKSRK